MTKYHDCFFFLMLFQVLLMSLRAGGVGLNLTAASNVFIMVDYACLPSPPSTQPMEILSSECVNSL